MPQFDLPLEELRAYRSALDEPADFDAFWAETLASARRVAWAPRAEPVRTHHVLVDTADVTFAGFGGEAIRAWWRTPRGRAPLGIVVEYLGDTSGRGLAHQVSDWALAGFASLTMDTRGQGGIRTIRATPRIRTARGRRSLGS